MKEVQFDIKPFGERAVLVQINKEPSQELLDWLLSKRDRLSELLNTEVIHTYNELLIKWKHPLPKDHIFASSITNVLRKDEILKERSLTIHRVPVCYEGDCAVDMESYAKTLGLPVSKIIELHTAPVYTIYFLGFLPGFPYLQGLDKQLHLARKATPSRVIPKGGVGIGGGQTGIYPQESPGGWHIIGQTTFDLFDIHLERPSPFKAGDQIQLYAISQYEFENLKKVGGI